MTEEQIRQALEVLQAAADSAFGFAIEIETFGSDINSPSLRGKGILYQVRYDFPHLRTLQIRVDPDNPNLGLWIVKLAERKEPMGEVEW